MIKNMAFRALILTLTLLLSFFFFSPTSSALNSDGLALLALKAAITTDPTHFLHTWFDSHSTPCKWRGITCNAHAQVTGIDLSGNRFSGYIPSELGALVSLRRLSLSRNNFSEPIPSALFNASSLLSLDLSHNSFSGPLPHQINTLKSLVHVDLSSNLLNGSLPLGLAELPQLSGTVNLSFNRFSGEVPASYGRFPVTVSLDLRYNNLTGRIPQVGSLLNQGPTAFTGNPNLCGFPLKTPCSSPDVGNPDIVPENPRNPNPSLPGEVNNIHGVPQSERAVGKAGFITVPIISGVSFVVGVISVSVWLLRRKWSSERGIMGKERFRKESSEEVDEVGAEGQRGKFVVVDDDGFELELEELLRASAYVVGKSRSGIVYKVVVVGKCSGAPGRVVAVRRLSEGGDMWRFKEFETEVESIARAHHPNIVRLRAYYYASDEKLLVSDFVSNGSLYSALHGGPSNSLPPLSWCARLKIAQGTARGLMYIHEHNPRSKHAIHGNLKSSKILLDDHLQPRISGVGLTRLFSTVTNNKTTDPTAKKQSSNHKLVAPSCYLAPEARISGGKLTQKSDVYSFGIIVLEILTGRSPEAGPDNDEKGLESFVRRAFREERPLSDIIDPALLHEVHAKKQVLAAFHIALNCTELVPEMRPRMRSVSEDLERIGRGGSL